MKNLVKTKRKEHQMSKIKKKELPYSYNVNYNLPQYQQPTYGYSSNPIHPTYGVVANTAKTKNKEANRLRQQYMLEEREMQRERDRLNLYLGNRGNQVVAKQPRKMGESSLESVYGQMPTQPNPYLYRSVSKRKKREQ
jgi:hypothetical protein